MPDQEAAPAVMPYNQAAQYLQLFVNAFQGATRLLDILRTAATAEAATAEAQRRLREIESELDQHVKEAAARVTELHGQYERAQNAWATQETAAQDTLSTLQAEIARVQAAAQARTEELETTYHNRSLSLEKDHQRAISTLTGTYEGERLRLEVALAALRDEEAATRSRVSALQEALAGLRERVVSLTMSDAES